MPTNTNSNLKGIRSTATGCLKVGTNADIGGELNVTGPSELCGDVLMKGDLEVLGCISSSKDKGISIKQEDLPLTISEPGHYHLCENLSYAPTGVNIPAIQVESSDVIIDLCGHVLEQTNDVFSTVGVDVLPGHDNFTLIGNNGVIRNFSQLGVYVEGDNDCVTLDGGDGQLYVKGCGGKTQSGTGNFSTPAWVSNVTADFEYLPAGNTFTFAIADNSQVIVGETLVTNFARGGLIVDSVGPGGNVTVTNVDPFDQNRQTNRNIEAGVINPLLNPQEELSSVHPGRNTILTSTFTMPAVGGQTTFSVSYNGFLSVGTPIKIGPDIGFVTIDAVNPNGTGLTVTNTGIPRNANAAPGTQAPVDTFVIEAREWQGGIQIGSSLYAAGKLPDAGNNFFPALPYNGEINNVRINRVSAISNQPHGISLGSGNAWELSHCRVDGTFANRPFGTEDFLLSELSFHAIGIIRFAQRLVPDPERVDYLTGLVIRDTIVSGTHLEDTDEEPFPIGRLEYCNGMELRSISETVIERCKILDTYVDGPGVVLNEETDIYIGGTSVVPTGLLTRASGPMKIKDVEIARIKTTNTRSFSLRPIFLVLHDAECVMENISIDDISSATGSPVGIRSSGCPITATNVTINNMESNGLIKGIWQQGNNIDPENVRGSWRDLTLTQFQSNSTIEYIVAGDTDPLLLENIHIGHIYRDEDSEKYPRTNDVTGLQINGGRNLVLDKSKITGCARSVSLNRAKGSVLRNSILDGQIRLTATDDSTILDNTISVNPASDLEAGIFALKCTNLNVKHNEVSGFQEAVYLDKTINTHVEENTFRNNAVGTFLRSIGCPTDETPLTTTVTSVDDEDVTYSSDDFPVFDPDCAVGRAITYEIGGGDSETRVLRNLIEIAEIDGETRARFHVVPPPTVDGFRFEGSFIEACPAPGVLPLPALADFFNFYGYGIFYYNEPDFDLVAPACLIGQTVEYDVAGNTEQRLITTYYDIVDYGYPFGVQAIMLLDSPASQNQFFISANVIIDGNVNVGDPVPNECASIVRNFYQHNIVAVQDDAEMSSTLVGENKSFAEEGSGAFILDPLPPIVEGNIASFPPLPTLACTNTLVTKPAANRGMRGKRIARKLRSMAEASGHIVNKPGGHGKKPSEHTHKPMKVKPEINILDFQ